MAKSKPKPRSRRKTRDGLKILDMHFGTFPGDEELDAQFDEQIDVAQALYDARTAARLTQSQVAKRAKTTQQVISQLEDADYQGHSLSMLRRIAAALNRRVEIRLVPIRKKKLGR
ncbi:MAG TPA: XRE family transcriptional regulator [Lacipirellulaceae bacterium]|nr:XRE family transcriptional regulator [Lacipirellulaceae bacterium]